MLKPALYIICSFIAAFAISGINFNGLFKKDKVLESRIFVIVISLSLGYLLTNFVMDFINLTSIIK